MALSLPVLQCKTEAAASLRGDDDARSAKGFSKVRPAEYLLK